MNAHSDLDRQLNDFLRDGPEELPYQSFDAVRDLTEQTGQRVVIGPWRLPEMNKIVTIGLGAAAVVLAVIVGIQFFGTTSGGTGGPGDEPTATAYPTATPEPAATPEPSPSEAAAPPLSQSFTSTQHGISVSYPDGWIARAATEPWTDRPDEPEFAHPGFDVLNDPVLTDHLFLAITSQPIGDATAEDWVTEQMTSEARCATTEPFSVGGATGLIGGDDCTAAVVTTDGRGYSITLLKSDDDPDVVAPYDGAWFEEVLATVRLHPEDALD
jgi:hypothetical protein